MKCFFHSADLDGHCSGAIVRYFNPNCELIGINYGDEFPWADIKDGEIVYMVDFSLQPFEDMLTLSHKAKLIWIDHHISAIKEHQASQIPIEGLRRNGIGACQLTWKYLSNDTPYVPYAVQLLAQYDVWDHSNPNTLPFQYAMRMEETYPYGDMDIWAHLFENDNAVNDFLSTGETILKYIHSDNAKYCKSCSFETEIDGLKCIAVNKMLTNSQVFDSVWDPKKYDAMLTFGYRKGKWTVSLYTDKSDVDVSLTAKKYGGGGHKQAAGFQCSSPYFLLP